MSVVEPGASSAGLVARVKALLTNPAATWDQIDVEPASVGGLFRGYVLPLSAIPAVAGAIGLLIFGISGGFLGFGFSFRPSPVWIIGQALLQFGLGLVGVFIMSLVIDALATSFGGEKNRVQATKVAAYSWTAAWVAGVAMIVPALGIVAFLGALYSFYLLYVGLPKLMKTPDGRRTPYFAAVLIVAIIANALIFGLAGAVMAPLRMGGMAGAGAMGGTVKIPGQGEVDLGKLEEQGKRLEDVARKMESGQTIAATDPEVLKGYLPASVAGYTRTSVEASSGEAAGIQGATAEGTYEKAGVSFRLKVADIGGAGALAGMASAFKVKSHEENADGYEKIDTINGRLVQEKYNRASKSGEYSVLVGQRFAVEASGEGVTMDELKAAVNAIGIDRLESLAKAD
ncbi:MAG: YIP1 family protein [Phenylobacterium zucineum]|nr:MAG: YIP1 family protein [Phenylobacterium zucineum]